VFDFDPARWLLFEAGSRPGSRLTFLSRYKKVSKEKRPNVRDPFASLRLRRGHTGRWFGPSLRSAWGFGRLPS
jgi:hypothetical protein